MTRPSRSLPFHSIDSYNFCSVNDTVEHHCTGTAGVVVFNGTGESNEALLDRADAAMYEAKQAGRNCMRFSEGRLGG